MTSSSPCEIYPGSADHWDMDPMALNCKQLNEARILTSSTIDQLAERIIENSNRSTAASSLGLTVGNPERGENFVGLRSSGVSPEVNEFRKLRRKRIIVTRSDTPLRGAADFRNFGRNASLLG